MELMATDYAGQFADGWFDEPSGSPAEERAKEVARRNLLAYQDYQSATNDRERLKAVVELIDVMVEYPSRDIPRAMVLAEQDFYRRVIATDDPRLYESTSDMPALELLAYRWQDVLWVPGLSPLLAMMEPADDAGASSAGRFSVEAYAVSVLPIAMAVLGAYRWRAHRRLLEYSPLARGWRSAAAVVVSALAGWCSQGMTMLPTALVALVRNGLGDPAWPVVVCRGAEFMTYTVGEVLMRSATLTLLVAVVFALLFEASLSVFRRMAPGVVGMAALMVLPLMPHYYDELSPVGGLLAWLPSTYLYIPKFAGVWSYLISIYSPLTSDVLLDLPQGVLVLSATAGVLAVAVMIASLLRWALGSHHRGSSDGYGRGGSHVARRGRPGDVRGDALGPRTSDCASPRSKADTRASGYVGSLLVLAWQLRLLCSGGLLPAIIVGTAIVFMAPGIISFRSGMDSYTPDAYMARYRQLYRSQSAEDASSIDSEVLKRELQLLSQAAYAPDERSFARAALTYETWRAEAMGSGNLPDALPADEKDASLRVKFYRRLLTLNEPYIYLSAGEMPLAVYVSFLVRLVSPLAAVVPAGIAAVELLGYMKSGLFRQAPVARLQLAVSTGMALFMAVTLALVLAVVVAIAPPLLRHGIGEWGYPCLVPIAIGEGVMPAGEALGVAVLWALTACAAVALLTAAGVSLLCRDGRVNSWYERGAQHALHP